MPQHRKETPHDSRETEGKGPPVEKSSEQDPPSSQTPSIPDTILQFLNALPTTGNAVDWIAAFGSLLEALFEDVDHVEMRVNLNCPLMTELPHALRHAAGDMSQQGRRNKHSVEEPGSFIVSVPPEPPAASRYQEPRSYDYHYDGRSYLATALLRREEGKEPISAATHSSMIALEPFMLFAFSDLVARYCYAKPIGRKFHEVLRGIALERGLTDRELEVLTYHLFGRKYDEIARHLFISIDTVKKHVKRIHRKTEARSAMELFARYFTPLIDDDEPLPPEE